jgi:hypothetical protein
MLERLFGYYRLARGIVLSLERFSASKSRSKPLCLVTPSSIMKAEWHVTISTLDDGVLSRGDDCGTGAMFANNSFRQALCRFAAYTLLGL